MIIKRGYKGINVLNIQTRLQSLGYKVTRDGLFGLETEKAVKQFQQDKGLNPDGIVGPLTFKALGLKPVIETIEKIKPISPITSSEVEKPVSYTIYYVVGFLGILFLYFYLKKD